ncbi:MAG: chemotaxis protein CheR [Gammaproteobacteria bacterium]|nr:MAG: chemotaxis protein CheR [Gammaproteobacteria bacterium]
MAQGRAREFEYRREDFAILKRLSNQHSGIIVTDDKFDMFYARLSRRVRALGLTSFREYCQLLERGSGPEFTEFINSVTTNLTSFFREKHHFDYLKNTLIPELIRKNSIQKRLRIWSAGCSTGEEVYSIAMTLLENLPDRKGWDIKILATDLDTNVLATAAKGVYSKERITGLDAATTRRWFLTDGDLSASQVRVHPDLQKLVTFKQLNLMAPSWPMRGPFDIIFCRNVLIYFDSPTKEKLANRYGELIAPQGHLFIGHSESLHQLQTPFKLIGKTIYHKL